MKKLLLFSGILCAFFALQAQTILFQDNFDSYTAGDKIASVNSNFTTWSNAPGGSEDGTISTEKAASPSNSLKIVAGNDVIFPIANFTTDEYVVEFDYFVDPAGVGAFFNILHKFAGASSEWAMQCFFHPADSGYIAAGTLSGSEIHFTYPTNQFFHVYFHVNLTTDEASLKINNVLVHTWPFHYQPYVTTGLQMLGGVNFYACSPSSDVDGTYYVDNFKFTKIEDVAVNETVNNFTIYPNPVTTMLNIKGVDVIQVEMFNLVGQKVYTGNESSINVESFVAGTYFVKVITQTGTFTKKAIIK